MARRKLRAPRGPEAGTQILRPLTHSLFSTLAIALAAIAALTPQAGAADAAAAREPRVVAISGDRAYIDSPDLARAPAGTRLLFLSRRDAIARGELLRAVDSFLVVARLDSGSLAREKKLEKIRVVAQPAPLPPLSFLRVGYPTSGRNAPLFACPPSPSRPSPWTRVEGIGPRSWRLVPDTTAVPVGWPETLVVRLFEDAADQEIALERGEIDVAVFWPGELSMHMREHPRWRGFPFGSYAKVLWASGVAPEDTTVLDAINREIFRGDLVRQACTTPPSSERARFEVDVTWPGKPTFERLLAGDFNRGGGTRTVRFLSTGLQTDYIWLHLNSVSGDANRAGAILPIFEMRSPVVCRPDIRPAVAAIANELVLLLRCAPKFSP